MATPYIARNQQRVLKQISKIMAATTSADNDAVVCTMPAGRFGFGRCNPAHKVFISAGTPTGAAVSGMANGVVILDTTNSIVYHCTEPSTGTFTAISARA
jgi:hypothetical protein